MTKTIRIRESQVAGAMVSLHGAAPFHRAPLILVHPDEIGYFKVQKYLKHVVKVDPFSQEDWDTLVLSGEITPLTPCKAELDMWIWVFRKNFAPDRKDIIAELDRKQQLHFPTWGDRDAIAVLVVETELDDLQSSFTTNLLNQCEQALVDRREDALALAQTAFCFGPSMTARGLALLAVAYDLDGNKVRADAYGKIAKNSKSQRFVDLYEQELNRIRALSCTTDIGPKNPELQLHIAELSRRWADKYFG